MPNKSQEQSKTVTPGRVAFLDGQSELPMLEVCTVWSRAEIYLHGAHVTGFQKTDEPPLLFMSQCSRYEKGQPIRGGVPLIFPWFGARAGLPAHGLARTSNWDLKEVAPAADGSVSVRFGLPPCPEADRLPPFSAEYVVTVNHRLSMKLIVKNLSPEQAFTFENCLHTYFGIGDATAISITGLKGAEYLDQLDNLARKTETADAIRISSEVNRVYLNTSGPVEIHDPRLRRKIRVEKQGSLSTVVWNPWIAKAQLMSDFGNDEYQRMVCVESGNVKSNQITLPPGQTSVLTVTLSSEPLG